MKFLFNVGAVLAPWYRHRPRQLFRRLLRGSILPAKGRHIVTLPWGVPIRVNVGEAIGASIWYQGIHDLPVTEVIWRLLEPGDSAIDAGANIGYMSGLMAYRVAATGRVTAFEPHPELFKELRFNCELISQTLARSVVVADNRALSDLNGTQKLYMSMEWGDNEGLGSLIPVSTPASVIEVSVTRLDDVIPGTRVALLKVDVEGHEAAVLRGASRLLSQGRIRTILFEHHDAGTGEAGKLVEAYGFTVFKLDWTNSGPICFPVSERRLLHHDRHNYLATLDPAGVSTAVSMPGWRVFGH